MKNEAYRVIHDIADQRRGTLALAFAPERGMEMFMDVYPRFYRDYPQVEVVPRELSVHRQLELLAGDAWIWDLFPGGGVPAGINQVALCREEFLLITPLNHPLAAQAAPRGSR